MLEPSEKLQKYIEWFFSKISAISPSYKYDNLEINEFADGKSLKIPRWYNIAKGHRTLEPLLKKTFHSLNNKKYNNEGKLQEKLTNIIAKCYPVIAKESFDILKQISDFD